ncbi:serpentine type 7TM GPCR receptor class ab chemoreceptor domain-containing protein [Ditylenchus destructor]|uniref:Serpentine type 7TM GPCR receptor class ab chemoreceptor domain-containing protein n=1 Tax=Ditylenchus destructor TaxID=166010 RepID=A0AAD4QTJ4_9BILA|nr:serpentine type 7TM GPCR receptor class ab chemoreceptor domain-containing protein [Ditylenchus destructor]
MDYTSTSSYLDSAYADCDRAAKVISHKWWIVVRAFQVLISLVSLVMLPILITHFKCRRMKFHVNLSLLVVNVIILYALECIDTVVTQLRFLILNVTYVSPCDFQTDIWLAITLRLPAYIYLIAFPLIHCAVTAERAWATVFAKEYEKVGCTFGVVCTIFVWLMTFGFGFFIAYTASLDVEKPLLLLVITTPRNRYPIAYMHWVLMLLIILTSVADYMVIVQNRRYRKKLQDVEYNLSMNFQLRENMVTMQLIWPLDVFFTIIFTVYLIAGSYMRSSLVDLSPVDYMFVYELINTLFPLHTFATLLLYTRYIKAHEVSRSVKIMPINYHKEMYFKELQKQWA